MIKTCFASLAVIAASATPTYAISNADLIAEMAGKCWTLPENIDYQKAAAIFEVSYNQDGELADIITVEYQPVRKAGEIFALSAQQALYDCANKTDFKSRTIRVVMRYTAPRPDGALIMKKSLR